MIPLADENTTILIFRLLSTGNCMTMWQCDDDIGGERKWPSPSHHRRFLTKGSPDTSPSSLIKGILERRCFAERIVRPKQKRYHSTGNSVRFQTMPLSWHESLILQT